MTTTFLATVSALAQFAHGPLAAALDELPVAVGLNAFRGVSRKPDHDDLPAGSQPADRGGEPTVARARGSNPGRCPPAPRSGREIAPRPAQSGARARASHGR